MSPQKCLSFNKKNAKADLSLEYTFLGLFANIQPVLFIIASKRLGTAGLDS